MQSIASFRPSASLCTLPDELLGDIFSALPSTYILPPINRQLLPFHRSQLFRNVFLNIDNIHRFAVLIHQDKQIRQFPLSLTFDFPPVPHIPYKIPHRSDFDFLLSSLHHLKRVEVNVADVCLDEYRPTRQDFERNPQLEIFSIRTLTTHPRRDIDVPETDVFNILALRWIESIDIIRFDDLPNEDPTVHDYRLVVERDPKSGNYCVRNSGSFADGPDLVDWLGSSLVTEFQSVSLLHSTYNDLRLRLIRNPQLLTRLSLFSFDVVHPFSTVNEDYLAPFPNLTHLSIGGTAFVNTVGFFRHLRSLPLVSLHILPQTVVTIQHVIDLFKSNIKPNPSKLEILILDNINCEYPNEDTELPESDSFLTPEWTEECGQLKVEELRDLLRELGIKTRGSTFRGLDITDSVAYEGDNIREESRYASEGYDSEMEEEAEVSERELDSEEEDQIEAHCGNNAQNDHDEQSD